MRSAFDAIDAALGDWRAGAGVPRYADRTRVAPFKSGVERILRAHRRAVVPMALRNLWSSMWSRRGAAAASGRMARMRVPRRFRAHVAVMADAPVDGAIADAPMLEARVRALRGDNP